MLDLQPVFVERSSMEESKLSGSNCVEFYNFFFGQARLSTNEMQFLLRQCRRSRVVVLDLVHFYEHYVSLERWDLERVISSGMTATRDVKIRADTSDLIPEIFTELFNELENVS